MLKFLLAVSLLIGIAEAKNLTSIGVYDGDQCSNGECSFYFKVNGELVVFWENAKKYKLNGKKGKKFKLVYKQTQTMSEEGDTYETNKAVSIKLIK